ncbi:potassium transporter TrkA [Streptomyces lunaelactis]|uniref:potassium transporter TrkA n=1 Tax=Streptomyces lunaelactis TaxID=1535768 RepID=UPI001584A17A|nr:potassium transporter TrkA [Streptomyces lunaelactis]NUK49164.1 potassium transporter TrkA [Streptomyces lunaelactis]NUK62915.1 potassium transporter TrkA [Streptomyces lunaelactis]NUK71179.1 potassium transporter TrkA [Streptomyces lunaelactis]NUK81115.1 potassium transporter TrkA [Streptomyces lunaelactis]
MIRRHEPPTLVVIGTGSLARAVCVALARTPAAQGPGQVHVLGRDSGRASSVCYLARAEAALCRVPRRFVPGELDSDDGLLRERLAAIRPGTVLVCASWHSPWERDRTPSAWTRVLDRCGFAATLPLQAAVALRVGRALQQAAPQAQLVNACYPDAVNPLLYRLGLPVVCGVGNGTLITASVETALGPVARRGLRVLAHHRHLHRPDHPDDEARVWLGNHELGGVGQLLAPQRGVPREALNPVTAHTVARLLTALHGGPELRTAVPGPQGLPGGYPARVTRRRVELDLPYGLSLADAVGYNERLTSAEGVRIDRAGDVHFAPSVREALRPHLPQLCEGFRGSDTQWAAARMWQSAQVLRRREDPADAVHARGAGGRATGA